MQNEKILNEATYNELSRKLRNLQDELESVSSVLQRIRPSREAGGYLEMTSSVRLTSIGGGSSSGELREVIAGHVSIIVRLARYTGRLGNNAASCADRIADVEGALTAQIRALGNGDDAPFAMGGNGSGSGGGGNGGNKAPISLPDVATLIGRIIAAFFTSSSSTTIMDLLNNAMHGLNTLIDHALKTDDALKALKIFTRVTKNKGFGGALKYMTHTVKSTVSTRMAKFFGDFVGMGKSGWKKAGTIAVKWAGPVLEFGVNVYENMAEYEQGGMTKARMYQEIAIETGIDVTMDLLVGAAVAAAPFTGGTSLVVAILADLGVSYILESTDAVEKATDWILDDAAPMIADAASNAYNAVVDGATWVSDKVTDGIETVSDILGDAAEKASNAFCGWVNNVFA